MVLKLFLYVCTSFVVLFTLARAWTHQIKVSSLTGNDTDLCLYNSSCPCKTLAFVFDSGLNNSTLIEVSNGSYYLHKSYHFKHRKDISIVGNSRDVYIKCNTSFNETGLSWLLSETIVFRQLNFHGCGHLKLTPPFGQNGSVFPFYAGISFTYCKDVEFEGCTFRNSSGIAVVLYDTGGTVNVFDSTFLHNGVQKASPDKSNLRYNGGGGMLVHFTKYGSLFPFYDKIHERYSSNNMYNFKGSKFMENHYDYNKSQAAENIPSPFGWGGGLALIIDGTSQNSIFTIHSCTFERNKAIWGGGMFAEFHNESQANTISIFNSTFLENEAKLAGGAVRTGNNIIENDDKTSLRENRIEHTLNKFYTNMATLGGALSHYGWTYYQQNKTDERRIHFKDCIFQGNTATTGSAISFALNDENEWMEMGKEVSYAVELANCTVCDNVAKMGKVTGMGAVYSSRVPFILRGNNTFINNTNTAVLLDNAPLKIYDEVYFVKNIGIIGGALAFYGQSKLILTKNVYVLFEQNEAEQKGGAIYIRTPGPDIAPFDTTKLQRHQCLLMYDDEILLQIDDLEKWHARLVFVNNVAPAFCGNSVYANTLQFCYLPGEGNTNNKAFEWEGIVSYSGGKTYEEISTDPVAIKFIEQEWSNLSPYEKFNATIHLLDEKNSTVSGIVNITVCSVTTQSVQDSRYDHEPSLVPGSSLFLIQPFKDGNSTKSFVPGLRIKGSEGQIFKLVISTLSGQVAKVNTNMALATCPDGFEQLPSSPGKCVCMQDFENHHEGVSTCSEDNRNVYLKMGYWGGRVKYDTKGNTEFVTYPCPRGYCHQHDSDKTSFMYDKASMCSSHRSSDVILCGECKKNCSLSLGGEDCVPDSNCEGSVYVIKWGLPIFLLVVPFLVFCLLYLNVDIFTSYLNSWLYFYQVLPFVVQQREVFDDGMRAILDIAAWQLPGVNIQCFYKGLTKMMKLLLNYLFPIYVLIILFLISQITRCIRRNCFERTNVFRAISTILVLCYTNVTLISFNVCRWLKIDRNIEVLVIQGGIYSIKNGNSNVPALYYVLLVIAILVIIFFILALPVALLFRSCLVRKFTFMANFRNLYDIFDHCYRDGCRQFSAYYFVWRIVFLLLTSFLSTPGPYQRCWYEMLTVLSLVIFVYLKPYKTDEDTNLKWLNFVDTLVLTDLCIITIMSSSRNSEASNDTKKGLKLAIRFGSWLPMVYLFVLILMAFRHNCRLRRRDGYESIEDSPSGGTSGSG